MVVHFWLMANQILVMVQQAYRERKFPNCTILNNWVFDNFILTDEQFAKDLQIFETCVLVYNNLSRKLVSLSEPPTTFDERFKVTWVPFFTPDFNLLSCVLVV